MNLKDHIDYRDLNLKELEELMDANILKAAHLQVKISKKFINGQFQGTLYDDDKIYLQRMYNYRYEFIATTYMHFDFSVKLLEIEKSRIVSRRKGDEASSVGWNDRLKKPLE